MSRAIIAIARERDVTVGQILRDLVAQEIRRHQDARPSARMDERLVAPLRARLAGDLAHAPDWDALQSALRRKGYDLRPAGGGLALHAHPSGDRVCKASDLGFSYSRLMHRIGAPFPGHPHTLHLEKQKAGAADDPCLLEDF
ncbi:MAG: hypothetical protein R3D85_16120 [Paracoccaceae bacterium]